MLLGLLPHGVSLMGESNEKVYHSPVVYLVTLLVFLVTQAQRSSTRVVCIPLISECKTLFVITFFKSALTRTTYNIDTCTLIP